MIRIGVIGRGRHADALRAHAVPLGSIVLSDPETADALLVLDDPATAAAALRAGKPVLCPPGLVRTRTDLALLQAAARDGGGRLLPGGELAHSETGRRGLQEIADPGFGAVKSIYLAIRQPRDGGGAALAALIAEAVDFVLAMLPGGFPTIRVNTAALFGAEPDTSVILLRSDSDVVVTIEVSRCLPATLAAPGLGEVEIEIMGATRAVRITPGSDAVQVWTDTARRLAPWLNAPVLAMLQALENAANGHPTEDGLRRAARALALLERL